MNSVAKHSTSGRLSLVAFAGLLGVFFGCASQNAGRSNAPHPMLAAARANRISMFGDFGPGNGAQFLTRSSVSVWQHTLTELGGDSDVDVDAAGRRIVFASTRHNMEPDLYVKAVDGVAVTQLTGDPSADVQPAFSPDGKRVAFASDRSGQWDIWTINIDGGQPVRVTESPADEVHPSWSPDGTQLVFSSLAGEAGQWELWIIDTQAGGSRKFIGYGLFPEWSPIDDTILFQRARERGSRRFSIWTIQLVGGEPRYPTELASSVHHAFTLPTWSSDKGRIAFSSVVEWPTDVTELGGPPATYDIWLMNADGRGKTRLTDGHTMNYAPSFSSNGRLFFTSDRSGHDNIWSLVPGGGPIGPGDDEQLTATHGRNTRPGRNGAAATASMPNGS